MTPKDVILYTSPLLIFVSVISVVVGMILFADGNISNIECAKILGFGGMGPIITICIMIMSDKTISGD